MNQKELAQLSDDELRELAKQMKSSSIGYALMIGFMLGIIIFSFAHNTIGLVTLIPLYFVFRMLHKPERNRALKQVLADRGLD